MVKDLQDEQYDSAERLLEKAKEIHAKAENAASEAKESHGIAERAQNAEQELNGLLKARNELTKRLKQEEEKTTYSSQMLAVPSIDPAQRKEHQEAHDSNQRILAETKKKLSDLEAQLKGKRAAYDEVLRLAIVASRKTSSSAGKLATAADVPSILAAEASNTLAAEARKTMVTTTIAAFITVAVTAPLTIWITSLLQSPKPTVASVTPEPERRGLRIDAQAHLTALDYGIHKRFLRLIPDCEEALVQNRITLACRTSIIASETDVVSDMEHDAQIVENNTKFAKTWKPGTPMAFFPHMITTPGVATPPIEELVETNKPLALRLLENNTAFSLNARKAFEVFVAAVKALPERDEAYPPNGKIVYKVGILNNGDSGTVVKPTALLMVGSHNPLEIRTQDGAYIPLGARSFTIVPFVVRVPESPSLASEVRSLTTGQYTIKLSTEAEPIPPRAASFE